MGVDFRRMRRLGAGRNNENAGDFVSGLVQRNAILEGIHDSFGGVEAHRFVQGWGLEAQIHERDAPSVARRDPGDVPRGLRGPWQIVGDRHQRDQRRAVDERGNEMPEPRERQLPDRGHCPGW